MRLECAARASGMLANEVGHGSLEERTKGSDLLPTPKTRDPLSDLYAIVLRSDRLHMQENRVSIEAARRQRREAWARQLQELQRAAKEASEGGFWRKVSRTCSLVGRTATVIGSVALAVVSCGAATPVAALAVSGAVLSSAAFAQGEFRVLQKLGMDEKAAMYAELGLSCGAIVCSGGSQLVGGLAHSGRVLQSSEGAIALAGQVSTGVAGAALAASGAAQIAQARHEARAQRHSANGAEQEVERERATRRISRLLDAIEQSEEADQRTLETLRDAIETRAETTVLLSGRMS